MSILKQIKPCTIICLGLFILFTLLNACSDVPETKPIPPRQEQPRTIRVVNPTTGKIDKMEIAPITYYQNKVQPITVPLGGGATVKMTFLNDPEMKSSGTMNHDRWSKLRKGLDMKFIRGFIGPQGRIETIPQSDVEIWMYKYDNGQRKHISFIGGKVVDWK